jgi:hypothetical protein
VGALRFSPGACANGCCFYIKVACCLEGFGGLAGASVTIKHGGVVVASGTTNADGKYIPSLAPGSYTVDVSGSRITGVVGHAFTLPGPAVLISTSPNPSYDCGGGHGCANPLLPTLHWTDSNTGLSGTMAYNSSTSQWEAGCRTFNFGGGTWFGISCPAATAVGIVYYFNGGTLTIGYTSSGTPNFCPVTAPTCNPLLTPFTNRGTPLVITSCPTGSAFAASGGGYTLSE